MEEPGFSAASSFYLRRCGCVKTPAVPAFDIFTKALAEVLEVLIFTTLFLILWLQPVCEGSKCRQLDEQSLNQGLIV